ncbi:sialin-like isoform X2 [Bacillus rossius redtenbacheri]
MLGTFLNVILRSSLPISLTVMVRRNSSGGGGGSVEEDTCPAPQTEQQAPSAGVVTGEFDWDEVTQSQILTAATYGVLASTLIGGRVSELWSPKYMFTICYGVSAAIYMLLPVTADWNVIAVVVSQVLSGLFSGPLQPVMMNICAAWFPPQERQLLFSITMAALPLGGIASNLLTGNLLGVVGWRIVFYMFASLVAAWTLLWMIFVYDSPNSHPRISDEERTYITESIKKNENQVAAKLPWKQMLLSVPMWAHVIMGLPAQWLNATLSNYQPTYMRNILHFDTAMMGNISAGGTVITCISSVFFGFLSQWIRKKKYLSHLVTYHVFNGISTLVPAVLLVILTFVGCNPWAIVPLLALVGIMSGAYIGGSQLNHMDLAVNYTGTIHGLSATVYSVVGIVAPNIVGVITNNKQTLTAWNTVFYIAAGVKILPFFFFLFFGSVKEQPWNRIEQEETESTDSKITIKVGIDNGAEEHTRF